MDSRIDLGCGGKQFTVAPVIGSSCLKIDSQGFNAIQLTKKFNGCAWFYTTDGCANEDNWAGGPLPLEGGEYSIQYRLAIC